ncbi:hypothetical protein CPC08DRAFT_273120 [Agrocybe pediades]|nr:hypothetical protein CPC08DRAFT_273120 [Agrocybe pediades]
MDVASTVYSLATGIVNFISEHQSKVDLEKQIANVVVQIQIAISPLLLRKSSSEGINHCLKSLQNVLGSVDKHLREWKDSRRRQLFALVHPWTYTQVLKDDRDELMRQNVLLTGAMHVVDHLKAYSVLLSPKHQPPKLQRLEKQNPREEVAQFWQLKIGGEMQIVRMTLLCQHLEQWIKKTLGDVGRNRLRLRLDKHNTSYVTLKSFQEFAGDMSLKDAVRLYCADPQFPLLVWISDDLEVNASKVAYAQAR